MGSIEYDGSWVIEFLVKIICLNYIILINLKFDSIHLDNFWAFSNENIGTYLFYSLDEP